MNSARATQTIECINGALQSGRVASMPDLLKVIQTIVQNESVMTVAELADMIKQDSAVLAKVIAAANSLGYNPTGVRITTVSGAIHVLGFNCVRRLAMSLLLMEHAGRTTTPHEQREMAAVSLCSGMIAQVAAEQMPLVDPEEAFISGALRNFGRLVLGTIMTDEFREARRLAEKEGNDDAAYREIFGLTPLELGYELLKSSTLPAPILNAIASRPMVSWETLAWSEQRLAHLASFSLRLSELALDPKFDAATFRTVAEGLARQYSPEVPGLDDFFPGLLERAMERLSKIARSTGGDSLDRYGLERLRRRVKGRDLPPPPPPPGGAASRSPLPVPPAARSIEEACELLQRDCCVDDAVRIALSGVHHALGLTEALYCAAEGSRGDFVLARGYGPLAERLLGQTLFRRNERNIFLLCHSRLENVVVRDATDPTLQPHLPTWLREAAAPKSFILLPVHQHGRVHGVMLVGWRDPQPRQLAPERLAAIRNLLTLVARATGAA